MDPERIDNRAAVLVLDNHQGLQLGERAWDCLVEGESDLLFENGGVTVPAEWLDALGEQLYRPLLEDHYGSVSVVRGHDPDALLEAMATAGDRFAAVDLFVMAHTNTDGGTKLAHVPVHRFVEELTPEQRGHLRLLYSMGCEDGNRLTAASMHHIGFQTFVGHVGASPNFLLTEGFLDGWLSGEQTASQAAERAHRAVREEILPALPGAFYCLYASTPDSVAQDIAPFVSGEDILATTIPDAPQVAIDADRFFGQLSATVFSGELRGTPMRASFSRYESIFGECVRTGCDSAYEEEEQIVGLLWAYRARIPLRDIARAHDVGLMTRYRAVMALAPLEGGIEDLRDIIADGGQELRVRKSALDALIDAFPQDAEADRRLAMETVENIFAAPEPDWEMQHMALDALRMQAERNNSWGRAMPPEFRRLLPLVEGVLRQEGIPGQLLQMAARTLNALAASSLVSEDSSVLRGMCVVGEEKPQSCSE